MITLDTADGTEVCDRCGRPLEVGEPYSSSLDGMVDDTPLCGIICLRCAR